MFKNKKNQRIVMSLFMVAVLIVSSAFAFLTDRDAKTNTFTMGRVKIDLTEPNWDVTNGENMWAGKVLPKDPTIQNVGSNDAFVYAMVEVPKAQSVEVANAGGTKATETDHPLFSFNPNDGWTLLDSEVGNSTEAYDYYLYAYDTTTTPNQSVTLFNEITFTNIASVPVNPNTGEPMHDLNVNVTAYAIQSDLGDGQIADAATAWDLYATQRNWAWPNNPYGGSIADLLNNHEFEFYSSFGLAANDVNNDTIGVNADVDFPDAVAGIYTTEGEAPTIVLFKDSTETIRTPIATDMNINMGGKVLNYSNTNVGLDIKNATSSKEIITIDGRIEGSEISVVGTNEYHARALQIAAGNEISLNGVTVSTSSDNAQATCIYASSLKNGNTVPSTLDIQNCTIIANAKQGTASAIDNEAAAGIYIYDTNAEISNCNISTNADAGESFGIKIKDTCTANITNCTIVSDSPYSDDVNAYTYGCNGIDNLGSATITNCTIKGVHSAVSNRGDLIVDGGTYEGYGHGGFYFAQGQGHVVTVQNAITRHCDYDGIYTLPINVSNNAGFYMGCCDNATVTMNHCDIYGKVWPIVIRSTQNEMNNTLIISNSRINKDYTGGIRCNTARHTIDIRGGCNFTMDDVLTTSS